ncbi:hypothetical protein [Nocardia sp. A7]|uniref:hypothetical protein n=1 Tax=Nocardia sp. A7 TaxID=2789274 RepID=UPI00397A688B
MGGAVPGLACRASWSGPASSGLWSDLSTARHDPWGYTHIDTVLDTPVQNDGHPDQIVVEIARFTRKVSN